MSTNHRRSEPLKVRSTVARQAFERNGAGKHLSSPKRQRSRSDAKRHAIRESW